MATNLESCFIKLRDSEASVMSLAAKIGDWSTVYEILGKRPELVNFIPEYRLWGILHHASHSENEKVVMHILSIPDCDPNLMSRDRLRANELTDNTRLKEIIEAAQAGRPIQTPTEGYHVIKESFEELRQVDAIKINLMSTALEKGDIVEVAKIIDTNQHLVNVVPPELGLGPLHQAAIMGDVDIVNKLLYYPASNPDIETTAAQHNTHGPGKTAEDLTTSEEVRKAINWKKQQLTQEYYTCPTYVDITDSNNILMEYAAPTIEAHKGLLCSDRFDSENFNVFPKMVEDVFLYTHYSSKWEQAREITCRELNGFDNILSRQIMEQKSRDSFYIKLIEVYTSEKIRLYTNLNSELRNQAVKKNKSSQFSSYAAIVNAILFVWDQLEPYTEVTYRGMNLDKSELNDYSVGTEFAWLNFVSSSSDRKVAQRFGKNKDKLKSLFIFDNKRQCKWSPKSIEKISNHEREKEYLYPCGAQFRVTKVETVGEFTHIYLELICVVDPTPLRSLFDETVARTEENIETIKEESKQFDKDLSQLKDIVETANTNQIEMYNNDNYETHSDKEKPEKVELPKGVFIYSCIWCKTVCHDPCSQECGNICRVVISDNQCTVCSAKCSWSLHKKYPFKTKLVTERRTKINENMKKRYVSAETDYRESKASIENLSYTMEDAMSDMNSKLGELKDNISVLEFMLTAENNSISWLKSTFPEKNTDKQIKVALLKDQLPTIRQSVMMGDIFLSEAQDLAKSNGLL